MTKHLAIDANYISGTVHIENSKTIQVNFVDSAGNAVSFVKAPRLTLTVLQASVTNPYKVASVQTGGLFTGFVVGFQNLVTIDIEWIASERS